MNLHGGDFVTSALAIPVAWFGLARDTNGGSPAEQQRPLTPAVVGAARGTRRGICSSSRAAPPARSACRLRPRRTQSLGLYAISRATARSIRSRNVSIHAEPSLRGYENLRGASSDASTRCMSAFTSATLLSFGIA